VLRVVLGLLVVLALLLLAAVLGLFSRGSTTEAGRPLPVTPTATPEPPPISSLSPPAVAAEMSQRAFPGGDAPNVLLAQESASADALAASGLQGLLSAPLLLTASDVLSPETTAELDRLGDPEVHILGGSVAISLEIEQQLVAAGHTVHRHAGATGPHTAVDIAGRHFASIASAVLISLGTPGLGPAEAVVDSLPASSLAAADQLPVLLTAPDHLNPITAEYLATSGIERVLIVGDGSVISDQVLAQVQALGIEAVRVAAADRFSNAVAVAHSRGFANASDASVVVLAQGEVGSAWPASFIGSINTGRFGGAPMVLAEGATLPQPTRDFLTPEEPARTFLLCAPGVSEATCAEGRALVGEGSR